MPSTRSLALVVRLSVVGLLACGDGDGMALDPVLAPGTYVLESVTGRGPIVGSIILTAAGGAERRVRYAQPGGGLSSEFIASGTFSLGAGGEVDLRLREDSGRSPHVWRPRATLAGALLRLRHPDPADGPDIIESYRRR